MKRGERETTSIKSFKINCFDSKGGGKSEERKEGNGETKVFPGAASMSSRPQGR